MKASKIAIIYSNFNGIVNTIIMHINVLVTNLSFLINSKLIRHSNWKFLLINLNASMEAKPL